MIRDNKFLDKLSFYSVMIDIVIKKGVEPR